VQINLQQGHEGEIVGRRDSSGGSRLVRPAGQWNAFDVTVRGDRIALAVNGKPAYDLGGFPRGRGHVGLQVEVPVGGPFEFRRVRITELGHRSLFDGRDLETDWEPVGGDGQWTVEGGQLVCRGKGHSWLRSRRLYDDFNLRLDYLVEPGANSGVYVRVPADGNHHRDDASLPPAGFEVQILDDRSPRYPDLKDYQYSASVYDIAGASPRVTKPAGAWNTLEINARGPHVTVVHNGLRVVDVSGETSPLLRLRNLKGHLGLQSHNGVVRFRNLRLGPPDR
jgi:hypothetical protein